MVRVPLTLGISDSSMSATVLIIDGRQSETALRVARGTRRLWRSIGCSTVCELVLPDGRRADIVALAPDGSLFIVEVKSSLADFRADTKWRAYRTYCDRLYFAVPDLMLARSMPEHAGLIVADAYGAEILREAPCHRIAAATRRAMLLRFARAAADRLHMLGDPDAISSPR